MFQKAAAMHPETGTAGALGLRELRSLAESTDELQSTHPVPKMDARGRVIEVSCIVSTKGSGLSQLLVISVKNAAPGGSSVLGRKPWCNNYKHACTTAH